MAERFRATSAELVPPQDLPEPQYSGIALFSLDSAVLAFASWTIGFWLALALERGWAFALAFGLIAAFCLTAAARRWPATRSRSTASGDDSISMALVLAVVVLWPAIADVGTALLGAVAIGLLVLRLIIPARRGWSLAPGVHLLAFVAIALVAAVGLTADWAILVVVVCVVAAASLVWPQVLDRAGDSAMPLAPVAYERTTTVGLGGRRWGSLPAVLLGVFGVLISVWHVGTRWWSSDNTYYLNKAVHYAEGPGSFAVKDYSFGVDAPHTPIGSILSSFEPLLGTASAISGVSVPSVLFRLVVPSAMFLAPFTFRHAARGLGLRRADLAGAYGAAAIILMTGTPASTLFAQASYGKSIGAFVAIPLVIGAAGHLVRCPSTGNGLWLTITAISVVGLSPSLGSAALLVVAPFTVTALWRSLRKGGAGEQIEGRHVVGPLVPLVFIALYTLFAQALQQSAGDVQTSFGAFPSPVSAWSDAVRAGRAEHLLTYVYVAGGVALLPFAAARRGQRQALALLNLAIFGVLFAPWLYERLVVDLLDLEWYANRFFWALPLGVVVGCTLASMDLGARLVPLTAAALTLGLGLSGPPLESSGLGLVRSTTADVRRAPAVWPWDAGIPPPLVDAAHAIEDATPEGGRFLAIPGVEEVTTAVQTHAFPTYGRRIYVTMVGAAATAPEGFALDDRLLLMRGMSGATAKVEELEWDRALRVLEVVTVCTSDVVDPTLRAAVAKSYVSRGGAGACDDLWVRTPRRLGGGSG